jgi:hypothetical protein
LRKFFEIIDRAKKPRIYGRRPRSSAGAGFGVRLFEGAEQEIKLKLIDTRSYNGIAELIYGLR